MAKAREVGRPQDAATAKQLHELIRSVNSVTIRANQNDIGADGVPKHDTAPEQMEGRYITFDSKGFGQEVEVRHGLGRVPVGFIEVARTYASSLTAWPNKPSVNRSWSRDRVFFVTQAPAGASYTVLLL